MRRSRQVLAPLLASSALAMLAGCHHRDEMQRCVDETGTVVDQRLCDTNSAPHSAIAHRYRRYYGGEGSYSYGSTVYGGAYSPLSGHSYSSSGGFSSSTVRGGFGSSFGHFGG